MCGKSIKIQCLATPKIWIKIYLLCLMDSHILRWMEKPVFSVQLEVKEVKIPCMDAIITWKKPYSQYTPWIVILPGSGVAELRSI